MNEGRKPKRVVIPFANNKFINLTRRQHKFLRLDLSTIAGRQGASEDQKFVAKPTQLNMNLFFADGIKKAHPIERCAFETAGG